MSKYKVKMKLQGFELEIEGAREDLPLITQNIGEQMSGFLKPSGAIIEGVVISGAAPPQPVTPVLPQIEEMRGRVRRRRSGTGTNESKESGPAIDWKHNPAKYGMPKQDWNVAKKSLWLLYVVSEELKITELSAGQIAKTFNKHFKQAGSIRPSNVSRDLGKQKVGVTPSPVGEDNTKAPATWYLTDEGRKQAQTSVAEGIASAG
jgi:hypothetical protein